MPEDPTRDLTAVEMLRLLLADVRDMKGRLGALETKVAALKSETQGVVSRLVALETLVEDRFKDTRPIWQSINERTERIEVHIDRISP